MATTTIIASYFLIWWVSLFIVLPFGVRAQGVDGVPGSDPGAPVLPHILAKLVWTTIVATVIFGICATIYINGWVTLDDLMALMGMKL